MTVIITPSIEITYDVGVVWPDGSIEWGEAASRDPDLLMMRLSQSDNWRRIGDRQRGIIGLHENRDEFGTLVEEWKRRALINRQPIGILPMRVVRQRVTILGVGVTAEDGRQQEARLSGHLLVADPHDTADSTHPLAQAARLMSEAFAERSQS